MHSGITGPGQHTNAAWDQEFLIRSGLIELGSFHPGTSQMESRTILTVLLFVAEQMNREIV